MLEFSEVMKVEINVSVSRLPTAVARNPAVPGAVIAAVIAGQAPVATDPVVGARGVGVVVPDVV
jgi:hypothetical protein